MSLAPFMLFIATLLIVRSQRILVFACLCVALAPRGRAPSGAPERTSHTL